MADDLAAIDWQAPWLAPYRTVGEPLAMQVGRGGSNAQALDAAAVAGGLPVRFVPQSSMLAGAAYENYIFHSKQVPTREGLHDFFNGLIWLHWPQTKHRLNAFQAGQIARDGIQPVRGAVRDALTVFDENAAVLLAPHALWSALQAKDWTQLFVTQRALWAQASLWLLGHALLEKLVTPRKPITAHVIWLDLPAAAPLPQVDAALANWLDTDRLATKPFAHLPVLGVPGWWPANTDPAFYDDPAVFRAPRPPAS